MILRLLFLFMFPLSAFGDTYMTYFWNDDARIVLGRKTCDSRIKVANAKDHHWEAVVQNISRHAYLRGCWHYEPDGKLVHIEWEKGDFSMIESEKFKPDYD